jgi:hypothetical protein
LGDPAVIDVKFARICAQHLCCRRQPDLDFAALRSKSALIWINAEQVIGLYYAEELASLVAVGA